MTLTFYINPVPASRPRVTRWTTYYGKKYESFRQEMKTLVSSYKKQPLTSLLRAEIEFQAQIPQSYSKKKREAIYGAYCDNNADIDNYIKSILDSLNGVVFVDDSQIVEISAKKKWGDGKIIFSFFEV